MLRIRTKYSRWNIPAYEYETIFHTMILWCLHSSILELHIVGEELENFWSSEKKMHEKCCELLYKLEMSDYSTITLPPVKCQCKVNQMEYYLYHSYGSPQLPDNSKHGTLSNNRHTSMPHCAKRQDIFTNMNEILKEKHKLNTDWKYEDKCLIVFVFLDNRLPRFTDCGNVHNSRQNNGMLLWSHKNLVIAGCCGN